MTTRDGDDLHVEDGGARLTVRPSRGGMLTAFEVGGARVLFMDDATLADPSKNVRGGVPVLFPSPGKLAGDAWAYGGAAGSMKQHGFARDLPWRVASASSSAVALELAATPATRARFPWDFAVQLTYALRGATLHIEHHVVNRSATPMPFGFGFHPYFFVRDADKARARVATGATRAFDNVAKQPVALRGIDLTQPEVDLHLLDHGSTESALTFPGGEVRLRGSPEYTHWVVWTLAGRDFVCLEPWTCPGNALNTGERLIVLAPGASRSLWLELTYAA